MPETDSSFLFGYAVDAKGRGTALTGPPDNPDASTAALIWVHLDYTKSDAERILRLLVPDVRARELMLTGEMRPAAIAVGGDTFLALRGVNTNPGANPEDMVSVRIWFSEKLIVTTRRRVVLSVLDMRDAIEVGNGPRTTVEFATMLGERIGNRIEDMVDSIEAEITEVEQAADTKSAYDRVALSRIRRQNAAVRRYLAPQRDALDTLLRLSESFLTTDEAYELRGLRERFVRQLEDLDLARERAMVAQEEFQQRIAEQQNSRMFVLSIVAAVFLPLSFITGLFGMNVMGLPGTDEPDAFVYLGISMCTLTIAMFVVFRWQRWL